MNQEFLLFPGFREMWRGRDVLYYPIRVRYLINYPGSKMGVSALLPYKSMVLLLRGQVSRWVEDNGICFWAQDRRFLKEINPGSDEICLILGNPGETQPPPRVAISPQVSPPHLQFPETRPYPWESRGHRDRATILCGAIITWKRRKAIDIQHGRLGKLREAERAQVGRGLVISVGRVYRH